ncbi:MAG TPA: ATP-binding protein [Candidatus Eisenbacteria bacterium]|nr:ATP-binding protein [Candidatus Eisenbacteria bacterium]
MSGTRRGRSLFWPIATVLLVTVVIGAIAQWILADAVLRPLELRDARTRSEPVAARLAEALGAPTAPRAEADIESLLTHARADLGFRPSWVAYVPTLEGIVSDPHGRARQIKAILAPPGTPGEGAAPAVVRHEILARHAVVRDGAPAGEVIVIRPILPAGPAGRFGSLTAFLYLPIAILASAIAGLLMVRLLVRRLRAMEALAARISEGDLTVRVSDRSGDEIGRVADELDRMTDRLATARARIEANDRQRRQLFADITHELATPLTSIRGNAETLLDPAVPLTPEERDLYLRGIREEARRLDRLTRDLFDLARLEAGASRLAPESLDWAALCRNTIERFQPRFRDAGLTLEWRGPEHEAWIEADGHRLEQVLENLLANALRYVPAGGRVAVGLTSFSGGQRYQLVVEDDGPGIAAADLPQLFERFYRAPSVREARTQEQLDGSGLGLAIVRAIAEQHGGTATASARAPHGLSIAITLPLRPGGAA